MNAIARPRDLLPANQHSAGCAALADIKLGIVMEMTGDELGALYAPRQPLTEAQGERASRLRGILVAVAHARNLLAPMLTEGAQ